MENFLNTGVPCGAGEFKGTGYTDCDVKSMGKPFGMALKVPGSKLLLKDLQEAGYAKLVAEGKIFPLNSIWDYEQTTPEDGTATSPTTGKMQNTSIALPSFTFNYSKGLCAFKNALDKSGSTWEVIMFMEKGIFLSRDMAGTYAKGFTCEYVHVPTYKLQQGDDLEQYSIMFQISNADEFNARSVFIPYSALGFDPREFNGVIETALTTTLKAGTSIEVKVTDACNSSNTRTGLEDKENWLVNNVQPTAVTYDVAKESYKLTVTAFVVSDNVTIRLTGEDITGALYKGSFKGVVSAS